MPRSLSSLKRMRQNARRAARNKARKTLVKTRIRKVLDAVAAKDAAGGEKALREAASVLDRVACKRTIHPNTAARRKSRLARRVNKLRSETGAKA